MMFDYFVTVDKKIEREDYETKIGLVPTDTIV